MNPIGFWLVVFIIVLLIAGLFIWVYFYYKREPCNSTTTSTLNYPTNFIAHVPVTIMMVVPNNSPAVLHAIEINEGYAKRHGYEFKALNVHDYIHHNIQTTSFNVQCAAILGGIKEINASDSFEDLNAPKERYVFFIDHQTVFVNHGLTLSPLVYIANRAPFLFVRGMDYSEAIQLNAFLFDMNHTRALQLLKIGREKGNQGFLETLFRKIYDNPNAELHSGDSKKVLNAHYPVTHEWFTILNEENFSSPDNHFLRRFTTSFPQDAVSKVIDELYRKYQDSGLFQEVRRGTVWDPIHAIVEAKLPPLGKTRKSELSKRACQIPTRLVQNFEHLLLPGSLIETVGRFRLLNPDFAHKLTTTRDNQRFIRKHYDDDTAKAFNMLIPGAFRSDFWRYLYLYKKGGVYTDIKLFPIMPLNVLWERPADVILVRDPKGYYNAFMAAKPGTRLMKRCIEICMHNIQERSYGPSPLAVTGPWVVGEAVKKLYDDLKIGYNETVDGTILVLDRIHDKHIVSHPIFLPGTREVFMYTRPPQGFVLKSNADDMFLATGRQHYTPLWKSRRIYRDYPNEG
jgi:hypothetical protein